MGGKNRIKQKQMNTKDNNCGRSALARCVTDAKTHMGCRQSSCRHGHERVHLYHVQGVCGCIAWFAREGVHLSVCLGVKLVCACGS